MLIVRALSHAYLAVAPFSLADGECAAVQGASGSGKSLFLRALADLDRNDGEVLLDQASRDGMPAPHWRRQITYVAAESGWWEDRVGEHFADPAAAAALAGRLGLAVECMDWPVVRLSTGERQRLALVRALVQQPRVLLLDEPTSGLDSGAMAATESVLREVLSGGTSILLVTHDPDQAKRLASRFFHVAGGRVSEATAA